MTPLLLKVSNQHGISGKFALPAAHWKPAAEASAAPRSACAAAAAGSSACERELLRLTVQVQTGAALETCDEIEGGKERLKMRDRAKRHDTVFVSY